MILLFFTISRSNKSRGPKAQGKRGTGQVKEQVVVREHRVPRHHREDQEERAQPEQRGRHLLHPRRRPHLRHVRRALRVLLQLQEGGQEGQDHPFRRHEEQGEVGALRRPGSRLDPILRGLVRSLRKRVSICIYVLHAITTLSNYDIRNVISSSWSIPFWK